MGANWRTTLAGVISGLGVAADAIISAIQAGTFTGKTGTQLVFAIGLVLLGTFAKDKQVTGGSVVNTTNDANVVKASSEVSNTSTISVQSTQPPASNL